MAVTVELSEDGATFNKKATDLDDVIDHTLGERADCVSVRS
jgi:hypothetical protein